MKRLLKLRLTAPLVLAAVLAAPGVAAAQGAPIVCTSSADTLLSTLQNGFGVFTGWVAILAIPVTALMVGYHALARSTDPDPMSAAQHQKVMIRSLTGGVIAILSSLLVPAIINAFNPPCAQTGTTTAGWVLHGAVVVAAALHRLPATF